MTVLKSWPIHLAALVVSSALCVAQAGAAPRDPQNVPRGDSLRMTCDQASRFVRSAGSAVVYSGPDRYDLYHANGSSCLALRQVDRPAYVVTKDTAQCYIGYTCEEPEDDLHDIDR